MRLHWTELRRRGVFQTLAAYAVACWVVIEVVSTIAPAFLLPDWIVAAVTTLLVLGAFPVLVVSWRYDFTRDGIKRDTTDLSDEIGRAARRVSALLLIALLAVTAALWVNYFNERSVDELTAALDAQRRAPPLDEGERIESIAVLPFDDLSLEDGDDTGRLLADGIAEAVLHVLAQNEDLIVTSRTSSFAVRDRAMTAAEIGSILGVQALLEGSVQLVQDRLRVTTQLVRTSDQAHLWSNVYEAPLEDVFEVQDTIAYTVQGLILPEGQPRSKGGYKPSLEAYKYYLEARQLLRAGSEEKTDQAVRYLRQAVALEPDYADAWAWLGKALLNYMYSSPDYFQTLKDEARAASAKSLELDPDNGIALLSLGSQSQARNFEAFEKAANRALDVAPNNPDVLLWVGQLRKFEFDLAGADRLIRRAHAVAPDDDKFLFAYVKTYCQSGRAREIVDRLLSDNPSVAPVVALWIQSLAAGCDGDFVELFRKRVEILSLLPDSGAPTVLLYQLASFGHAEANRLLLDAWEKQLWRKEVRSWGLEHFIYGDDAQRRLDYMFQAGVRSSWGNPYYDCTSYAGLQLEMGHLEEAARAAGYARRLWETYYGSEGGRVFAEETVPIYAYEAWLLNKEGKAEEAKSLAVELADFFEDRGLLEWNGPRDHLTFGPRDHLSFWPALVLSLNGRYEEALTWLADAAEDNCPRAKLLSSSRLFEDLRRHPGFDATLGRMNDRSQKILNDLRSAGIREVLKPSLLMDIVEEQAEAPSRLDLVRLATVDGDLQEAATRLERLVEDSPRDTAVLLFAIDWATIYGQTSMALRLTEAYAELKPETPRIIAMLGRAHFRAGNWSDAVAAFRRAIELDAESTGNHFWLGMTLVMAGRADEAMEVIQHEPGDTERAVGLAIVDHELTGEGGAVEELERIWRGQPDIRFGWGLAAGFSMVGKRDRAFEVLEASYPSCAPPFSHYMNPLFANLHDDPRWQSFLRSNGTAPEQLSLLHFNPRLQPLMPEEALRTSQN